MNGIADKVKSEGMKLGIKAVSKVLESPDRAEKIMQAFQTVQKSQEKLEGTAQRLLNLGNLPSKDDIKDLTRKAGRLRREAKKILAVLDQIDADNN